MNPHKQHSFTNHRPKKYLGQNFLVDKNVLQKIIAACDLNPKDIILEIGPGRGALTREMAPQVKKIIAVETDAVLAQSLKEEFKNTNVKIVHADILKLSLSSLPNNIKVIGNLPYNIATAIIERIFDHRHKVKQFYMTVQWEHGLRMMAKPNSKDYGSLSCYVQYYADVKKLFLIKNTAFRPIPKVRSCFLRLDILKQPRWPVSDEETLFQVIRCAFSQRRKTILNTLSQMMEKGDLQKLLTAIKISPQRRAENLTLKNYILLTNTLLRKMSQCFF